jgi:phospholipid transport system substrate-binding protein
MMFRRLIVKGLLVLLLAAFPLMAAAQSPNDTIEEAAALLEKALEGRKEEFAKDKQALYAAINDILLPRFDRQYAAQLVLGKHWREASKEQRERFIESFYNALLQRYADGVLEYDQNMVTIMPFRGDDTKQRTMVRSVVNLDDGSKVPVNYALVKRDSGWMLFDVTVEGVSYIRNFRAELESEIRGSSIQAVIERLESEVVTAPDE